MYVLWTDDDFYNQYVLLARNTADELRQAYLDFHDKYNSDCDFEELVEKELDSFSVYNQDHKYYMTHIEDADASKQIYIFMFQEDGEGCSYHNETYLEISNDKNALLEKAVDYFEQESRKTTPNHIDKMLSSLSTKGSYSIPHGITYCCDMELFEFKPMPLDSVVTLK